MKLITRESNAYEASLKWDEQYRNWKEPDKVAIGKKLHALGPNPDPDDVDRVVGNNSWTTSGMQCDECDEQAITVMLGQEPYYESRTAWICLKCLKKAVALIEGNG